MRYAIVIEKAEKNYSAYVSDLPGCVATGSTIEETETQIREAIQFHQDGMREDGIAFPLAIINSAPAIGRVPTLGMRWSLSSSSWIRDTADARQAACRRRAACATRGDVLAAAPDRRDGDDTESRRTGRPDRAAGGLGPSGGDRPDGAGGPGQPDS